MIDDFIVHLKSMFFCREAAFLNLFDIILECASYDFTYIGEFLNEFGREITEEAQHILIYQNLSIASCSGADADGGYGQLLGNFGC